MKSGRQHQGMSLREGPEPSVSGLEASTLMLGTRQDATLGNPLLGYRSLWITNVNTARNPHFEDRDKPKSGDSSGHTQIIESSLPGLLVSQEKSCQWNLKGSFICPC